MIFLSRELLTVVQKRSTNIQVTAISGFFNASCLLSAQKTLWGRDSLEQFQDYFKSLVRQIATVGIEQSINYRIVSRASSH